MTNVKLSQIAPSPSNVDANTQFVAVESGNIDYLFTPTQFINGFNLLRSSVADQILSGGWNVVAHTNASGASVSVDCGQSPLQTFTNNTSGGVTVSAPSNDGQTILQITNGSTPGVVTFSGFTANGTTGDALTTTAGNIFSVFIWRISGVSQYYVVAAQGGSRFLRSINTRVASYVLALTDVSGVVLMNVGTANTLTVPPNSSVAFVVGTEIDVMQMGAGITTFVAGAGVTILSASASLQMQGQYYGATLLQTSANVWTLAGGLAP